jgi:hypothetical protein
LEFSKLKYKVFNWPGTIFALQPFGYLPAIARFIHCCALYIREQTEPFWYGEGILVFSVRKNSFLQISFWTSLTYFNLLTSRLSPSNSVPDSDFFLNC